MLLRCLNDRMGPRKAQRLLGWDDDRWQRLTRPRFRGRRTWTYAMQVWIEDHLPDDVVDGVRAFFQPRA